MAKILSHCPTCRSRMEVTQLSCTACETVVLGRFEPCRFCNLPDESLGFLEAFIRSKGNVKEMERELGTSYWTIRSQLNDLIAELGFEPKPDREAQREARKTILERLHDGEIDADEAGKLLETT
jgi:hypothetical protein